jgi:hypothetical protein
MTLEDVRQRCYIDEITGCWHWRGAFSAGRPRIYVVNPKRDRKETMDGMRAVMTLKTGKALPRGKVAYRIRCECDDCVNPEHAKIGTKAEQGEFQARTKQLRGDPLRSAVNKANSGRRQFKVTPEIALALLGSSEPGCVLAKRYGLCESTVSRYKRGLVRVPVVPAASIFALAARSLYAAANHEAEAA